MSGAAEGNFNERLYLPCQTKIFKDGVLRFWRYADFELDNKLAQEFNYEYRIMHATNQKPCKHLMNCHGIYLNNDSAVFRLKLVRYDSKGVPPLAPRLP